MWFLKGDIGRSVDMTGAGKGDPGTGKEGVEEGEKGENWFQCFKR